jgi:SAM-dependent methyltransferase
MAQRDWNQMYATGGTPWDTGRPERSLVEMVEAGELAPGRTLEIGCGTGTNALWLASRGFDVLGVDLAPLAIEQANARLRETETRGCRFEQRDIFDGDPIAERFDLVFDSGCFHVFDDADTQSRFAAWVAAALVTGGTWLSLIGSTEGAPRDTGPPRRSAADIVAAIEPVLEIVALRATTFDLDRDTEPAAWLCLSRKRALPAQPSTS